jgi:hypothetical protein
MATVYGAVLGVKIMSENFAGGTGGVAEVTFTLPAFLTASDTGKLGAGGYDHGIATTDTLATMISKRRRDGKTVTIAPSYAACNAESGLSGTTEVYTSTFTTSSGSLTFKCVDVADSGINATILERPARIMVHYRLS